MMERRVGVLLETEEDGSLKEVCYELANEAAILSGDLEVRVFGVLLGRGSDAAVSEAKRYGIENIYVYDTRIDPVDLNGNDRKFRRLCGIVDTCKPVAFLMGEEDLGISLSSFLAANCNYRTISNAQRIRYAGGTILVEKQVFNGRLLKTLKFSSDQNVAVLFRPGALGVGNPVRKATDIVVEHPVVDSGDSNVSIRYDGIIWERSYQVELTDYIAEADVVIGVGGGVDKAELLADIVRIAKCLNAAVGGTRVSVDKGIIPYEKQIGQTGKVIAPGVYIALGISGAIQHTFGIKGSKFIIAVNRDQSAPIMKMADLPCLSDIDVLVPVLYDKINAQKRT